MHRAAHRPSASKATARSSSSSEEDAGERDPLLDTENTSEDRQQNLPKRCQSEAIFPLLHVIRQDIKSTIDTHLDWNELTSLELNYSIVRPLASKYSQYQNVSIIFTLLVNRIQFQRDADRDIAMQNVNLTRASLCELLAIKLLRTFSRHGLELISALTFPFSPFQGADEDVMANEGLEIDGPCKLGQCSSALELAIFSKAKKFIKSPLCQRCITGIYEGRVVLSYQSTHAILDDSYKKRPLGIYDPAKAPFLDHYRLRVPMIRNRIEFINFCLLLLFYVLCLAAKHSPTWTTEETIFVLWLSGFALDEVAQLKEHGLAMYSTSLYNLLDFVFCIIGFCWFGLRISALVHHNPAQSDLSFDTLALGAILLCPRVASVLIQDNVILLALKAMLADFCFFMALAVVCFSGFLYTFWSLSAPEWTARRIIWIMMKVWFGNSYVGFDTAQEFSPLFGPPLMVFFAIMANTLLLTILISLLSNTFSVVAQNASEEAMYQHACLTLNGISTDALFSYMPPLNLLAIIVIMPASFILNPRWLHKLNISLLQFTSWPILLIIKVCSMNFASTNSLAYNSVSYMESTAEKATHLLNWLPLPRSRTNPDRDIIEAAFIQASNKHLGPDDWEEWSNSMLQIRRSDNTAATKKTSGEQYGSTGESNVDSANDLVAEEVGGAAGQLSTSSPLAKIFGRPRGNSERRNGRKQIATTNQKGRKHEGKDAEFESEIEALASRSETENANLLKTLFAKIEEHERTQKKMLELLQHVIQSKESEM